ncbi:MAG: 2-oxo acid dehydrogenase subunit E2 [Planctomycetaceae bacterium]
MAVSITIPRLGWSMEEGKFAGWLKRDGDTIRPGDVLFELEGEKALQEIESVDAGVLRIPPNGPQPGDVLKVGAVIGCLVQPGETPNWNSPPAASPNLASDSRSPAFIDTDPSAASSHKDSPSASPSVRRLARELGVSLEKLPGSGRAGRITEHDVRMASQAKPAASFPATSSPAPTATRENNPQSKIVVATPRARKTAARLGIDWRLISGTGRNGRVRERDILAASSSDSKPHSKTGSRRSVTGRRRVIADRLMQSRNRTVPVTLFLRADASNVVSLRQQFRSTGAEPVPAFHDIIIKLVSECLIKHPALASVWDGDVLVVAGTDEHHIGLAVDTDEGLIVPVLRDVRSYTLPDLARASAKLIEKARAGRLGQLESSGAVFTVSSLGGLGIESFTPVINYPEVAILGVGAIRKTPVVTDDDRIIAGHEIVFSLTVDHRAIDGAPAARFLQDLKRSIESPAATLLSPSKSS